MYGLQWIPETLLDLLAYIGWWKKSATIILLGLDNAGKTTLMYMLKDDMLDGFSSTLHPNSVELDYKDIRFTVYDINGDERTRRQWKGFIPCDGAIIYVVDASDVDRFEESKRELDLILNDEELRRCPIAIFGSKIDCSWAADEGQVTNYFDILNKVTGDTPIHQCDGKRPMKVFMCSLKEEQEQVGGKKRRNKRSKEYHEVLRWLSLHL